MTSAVRYDLSPFVLACAYILAVAGGFRNALLQVEVLHSKVQRHKY